MEGGGPGGVNLWPLESPGVWLEGSPAWCQKRGIPAREGGSPVAAQPLRTYVRAVTMSDAGGPDGAVVVRLFFKGGDTRLWLLNLLRLRE